MLKFITIVLSVLVHLEFLWYSTISFLCLFCRCIEKYWRLNSSSLHIMVSIKLLVQAMRCQRSEDFFLQKSYNRTIYFAFGITEL